MVGPLPDLPRLFLIADGFALGRPGQGAEAVRERTLALVQSGVRGVQLRDHSASEGAFIDAALAFADRLVSAQDGLVLVVNTHLDVARRLGCGGHVGRRGPTVREGRAVLGRQRLGGSAHAPADAGRLAREGADYVFFSPVFPTPSHPGEPGTGFAPLRWACEAAGPTPVYALGGITPGRVRACLGAGAHGVAVLSGLLDAADPQQRLLDYQGALA